MIETQSVAAKPVGQPLLTPSSQAHGRLPPAHLPPQQAMPQETRVNSVRVLSSRLEFLSPEIDWRDSSDPRVPPRDFTGERGSLEGESVESGVKTEQLSVD